jgi:hypothetical protein
MDELAVVHDAYEAGWSQHLAGGIEAWRAKNSVEDLPLSWRPTGVLARGPAVTGNRRSIEPNGE